MRLLVTGSRHFSDQNLFNTVMKEYEHLPNLTIIQGNAKGADTMAYWWALKYASKEEHYPANWDKYGKAAGPIRNKQMLVEGKPDMVIAFLAEGSIGTRDMIRQAEEAGIPVKVVNIS